jgi:hypothetical protein
LVNRHDIWYRGNAIQGDQDAIIFNPTSSTILKLLKFKVVSWRHDVQPCTEIIWDVLIVGLLCLRHIQSLANVTRKPWHVIYCKAKRHKGCDVTMATRASYLL